MSHIPASLPPSTPASPEFAGLLRRLESGAVLVGRVGRVTPQGATPVQVGGVTLPLTLPQVVVPGTVVRVFSSEGRIFVEPQAGGAQSAGGAPTAPSPASVPAAPSSGGGFVAPEGSAVAARVLQANQLPVRPEILQTIAAALGSVNAEQAPVLALLLARNLPITPENLVQIRERLRARGDLGKELGKLIGEIDGLLAGGGMRGSEGLARALVALRGWIGWEQSGPIEDRAERLKEFLATFEEKLMGGSPGRMKGDLKAVLLELEGMLRLAEAPAEQGIRATVRRVLDLVEGAQLMNLPQAGRPDETSWSYWRIPFPGDPYPTTVELAVRGERDPDRPERYHPGRMEVLVQMDLSSLGPVRIRMRTAGEAMDLDFSVSEVRFRELLIKELDLLTSALERAGYRRVAAEVRVEALGGKPLADEIDPIPGWEKRLSESPPTVDLKL